MRCRWPLEGLPALGGRFPALPFCSSQHPGQVTKGSLPKFPHRNRDRRNRLAPSTSKGSWGFHSVGQPLVIRQCFAYRGCCPSGTPIPHLFFQSLLTFPQRIFQAEVPSLQCGDSSDLGLLFLEGISSQDGCLCCRSVLREKRSGCRPLQGLMMKSTRFYY